MRGRAVAARRAHNPEVSGSNPLPATEVKRRLWGLRFFIALRSTIRHFQLKRRIYHET